MKKNDKTIEQLTSKQIKNLGFDETSADFTLKVMQSIVLEVQPAVAEKPKNYRWLFIFVPVPIAVVWYCVVTFKLAGYGLSLWKSLGNSVKPYIASFIDLFAALKSITISPLLMISFLAVLALLIIEDLTTRVRRSS